MTALIIQFSEGIYLNGTSESEDVLCRLYYNITSVTQTSIISLSHI
jgi:hypothetical protein